ncbi:MAG TPA: polysaccharide biosynthesis protein [Terracidiphilus sp.]|nr:polysaccharide biosynthesis protein [Terracidiphilus sp.]
MNLEEPMQITRPINYTPDEVLEDLTGKRQAYLDQQNIRELIQGKVVMVTGAAGSIGAELCQQIAGFCPLALVGFDQAETPLFQLEQELEKGFPSLVFRTELGNITQFDDVCRTMRQYQPSIVFHAAAYKHVSMLERHAFAAIENNILGTWRVAKAAASQGVESFVLISTDKAVRPASILGVTKRIAELTICAMQKTEGTKFFAVRFGNVLGSSGSVVPIFKSQIAAGGPVTVTHAEMRRYFITASEACQLVLQSLALGKGGEIFVLDMGQPVKIVDLARSLILSSGLQPDRDIKIEFIGVRPGEKLFEEVNLDSEHLVPTSHSRIRSLASAEAVDAMRVNASLPELEESVRARDHLHMLRLLKGMVPDYIPGSLHVEDAVSIKTNHRFAGDDEFSCTHGIEPAPVQTDEPIECASPSRV